MTTGPIVRGALVALTFVTLPASRAEALCHLFKGWFGAPATTTYYAPYTAAYAPAGCGQTVNYVAQTSYRTVFVNAPVTTMRPMPAVDGCTGCPTTVMRPVVTYVPQARLVPYTSYRPVVTAAAPCCGAVTTAAYFTPAMPVAAPAAVYAPAPVAPAPCCGGGAPAMAAPTLSAPAPMGAPGAAVPSLAAPTLNYPSAAPLTTAPPSASAYPGVTPYAAPPLAAPPAGALPQRPADIQQPALQPTPDPNVPAQEPAQNKTFDKPSESNKPAPESRLLLPPAAEPAGSNSNRTLQGLDPEAQDRFTAVPMRQVWAMKPVATALKQPSVPVQVTPAKLVAPTKSNDNNPWRAARP